MLGIFFNFEFWNRRREWSLCNWLYFLFWLGRNEKNYVKLGVCGLSLIILDRSEFLGLEGRWEMGSKGRGSIRDVLFIYLMISFGG